MSQELYHAGHNYCNCHPETCCCNPYAVFDSNDNKLMSFFEASDAEDYAHTKNVLACINEKRKKKKKRKSNSKTANKIKKLKKLRKKLTKKRKKK